MVIVSVALGANFSAVLSLLTLDTSGQIGLSLSDNQTASDTFVLYGTLDAAAVDASNAYNLGVLTGGAQNLPPGIAGRAKDWPYLLIQRTGGSTAGTLIAAGNPNTAPAPVSVAAPVAVGAYSATMNLTSFDSASVRIGGSRQMTSADIFDVYLSNDSTLAASTGAYYAGRFVGGGGTENISVVQRGYAYAIIQRVAGSTAGNIIAAGVAPPGTGSGGTLNLDTLNVGDTAVDGPIGGLPAADTVDEYSSLRAVQTTGGGGVIVRATLPSPTDTTAGKVVFVMNSITSTNPLIMYGLLLTAGSMCPFEWTGTAWSGPRVITQAGNAFGEDIYINALEDDINILLETRGAGAIGLQTAGGNVQVLPSAPGAGNTGVVVFRELAANGNNGIGLKGPDNAGAGFTYTLPSTAPARNGQSLASTIAGETSWNGIVHMQANNTSGQSIADGGGGVVITGWTEVTDTAGAFNSTTGVFTVPITGFYLITLMLDYQAIAAAVGAFFSAAIGVNGTATVVGREYVQVAAANVPRQPKVTACLQLTAGQQVTFRGAQTSGSGSVSLSFTQTLNFASIALIL